MSQSEQRAKDRISVLIITADNISSELLKNAFARVQEDLMVQTLTGTSREIIDGLGANEADIAIISDELQDGPETGIKVLQQIRHSNGTAAIMLLKDSEPERAIRALREGARGIFYRSHSLESLSKCIRAVHQGQIWINNEDTESLIKVLVNAKPFQFGNGDGAPKLTRREDEVLRLVVEGMKNREIAQTLKVKENAVRNYISKILQKLGVSSRVELVLYVLARRERGN